MNRILTSFTFIILSLGLNAQIAQYNFNNNIIDQANTNDAIYLLDGVTTATLPTYTSNGGTTEILLDPLQALQLPGSIPAAVDTTESLEIEFEFTVTDIGSGRGFKDLWNCSPGANQAGFYIFIRHDEFSALDDYEIVFSYADGGFELGIPDHPGHDETTIGYHLEGDVVSVRLILDFENRSWTSIVNGNYISKVFNDFYDWHILMESLKDNDWYYGWHQNQTFDMNFSPTIWTSTISTNELEIYSPRQAGVVSIVITALEAMTDHVDGTTPLSEAQRIIHLNELFLNYFNNHSLVATEVFNYINAYESNYPSVYTNRQPVSINSLDAESRLLIFLQQAIFDNEYTLANVTALDGIIYEFSEIFPGPVDVNATRVNNAIVEIEGDHTYDIAARTIADLSDAKRPTGYYAAPGEIITIDIPASALNAGLSVLVGAHDRDHSSLSLTNRFNRISKTYPLTSTSTEVISPFGGGIYIKIPLNSQLGWFDITVSGAVKSPYFSWRSGRESSPTDWAAELIAHEVEWVDLESDKYMMTLPLAHLLEDNIMDPSSLMMEWDDIVNGGFDYAGGRGSTVRQRAEYFIIDSRLPNDAFGTGYPQVIGEYESPSGPFNSSIYYPTQVLNTNFWDSELYITFHEMGHGALHPTLVDETESIVHMPAVYIYNQQYGLSMDDAFMYSSGENFTLHEAAMDWMIAFNFRNNNDMGCDPTMDAVACHELRYQHRGYAKYVTMADLFGWGSLHNMNKVFYDEWTLNGPGNYVPTKDEMILAASQSNGINMAPLFHFWGLAPSAAISSDLALLPTSPAILNKLIEYHNLVPETQADFQSWKDILLASKDPVHFDRINDAFNNYETENYTTQMKDQICDLIALYYPTNNFCDIGEADLGIDSNCMTISLDPTNNEYVVAGDLQGYSIQILSANGTVHQDLTGQNSPIIIDLTSLPIGLYFIKAESNNNSQISIERILKMN